MTTNSRKYEFTETDFRTLCFVSHDCLESLQSGMKPYSKSIFPIKAFVMKAKKLTDKDRENIHRVLFSQHPHSAVLNTVGYCHHKIEDNDGHLRIGIGVSFCPPEEYDQIDHEMGKQIAIDNTTCHGWAVPEGTAEINDPRHCNTVTLEFKDSDWIITSKPDCEEVSPSPSFYIQPCYKKLFKSVTLVLSYNIAPKKLLQEVFESKIGSKYCYVMWNQSSVLNQIRAYTRNLLDRYVSSKYKDFVEAYAEAIKDREEEVYAIRHCDARESDIKIKNNTVIMPIMVNIEKYYPKNRISASKVGACKIFERRAVGYIALRVEGKRWYIGASYCNPEDYPNFSHKHGRKLAYRRMMEYYEKNESGVVPSLITRIFSKNMVGIPNYHYSITEDGKFSAISYQEVAHFEVYGYINALIESGTATKDTIADMSTKTNLFGTSFCCEEE